jgi:hypothetical protein
VTNVSKNISNNVNHLHTKIIFTDMHIGCMVRLTESTSSWVWNRPAEESLRGKIPRSCVVAWRMSTSFQSGPASCQWCILLIPKSYFYVWRVQPITKKGSKKHAGSSGGCGGYKVIRPLPVPVFFCKIGSIHTTGSCSIGVFFKDFIASWNENNSKVVEP